MTPDERLVHQFCDYYHAYHSISPDRRRRQRKFLLEYASNLGHPFEELNAEDLRQHLLGQVEGGIAPSTIAQRLTLLRPFFVWLRQQRVIDADTLRDLEEVRPPRGANGKRRPRPYSRKELARFWRELDAAYPWAKEHNGHAASRERGLMLTDRYFQGRSPWNSARRYANRLQIEAIVALALYGGARMKECFEVDLEHIHPENHYIVIRGASKNRAAEPKLRPVPWTPPARHAIGDWLDLRARLAPDHDRPWLRLVRVEADSRKPMYLRKFQMLLTELGSGWQFHRMRHTCATEFLRAGMPLHLVSRMLGHAHIQDTLGYAELLEGDVVAAALRVEDRFTRAIREAA